MSKQSQGGESPVAEDKHKEEDTTEKENQIPVHAIINQVNNEKDAAQPQHLSAPIPVVKKPLHFYKGDDKYPWKLEQLDSAVCLEQLEFKQIEEKDLPFGENIEIKVKQTKVEGSGISKHVYYIVVGHDNKGEFECKRRYSEYLQFRKKLSELWIGIFMPILPSGSIGNPQEQVLMRIKYINNFWRLLSLKSVIFESEQVQIFLKNGDVNIETFLQGLKGIKFPELLQKYKNAFPEAYETSSKEQFLYKRQLIPEKLQKYQQFFLKKKITLSEYQDSFYRLADVKTKYFKAITKLQKELMPQYEDVLSKWFTGGSLKDNEPGIMEKMQIRQEQSKKEKEKEKESETKPQEGEIKAEIKVESKQTGLFSSQAFQSRFEDITSQIVNFNTSTSLIYDVLKFQLKDIDMVTAAIEQVRAVQKDSAYLNRSIAINKEQVQALNTNKTTLKTFLMGGSEDDKKSKLAKESADCEQKLNKVTALYNVLLVLVQEQMESYHKERADHYYRNITKALMEDLKVARCIMEFHVYENQLFGKERVRRIKELVGSQEGLEEIVSDST